jgi:hypothetical protein
MQKDELMERLLALDEEVGLLYPGPDRIRTNTGTRSFG